MKVLIQRVKNASVTIDGELYSAIDKGILALVGIEKGDTLEQVQKSAKKITGLRIFPDDNDKMNRSLIDVNGEMLIVSQFTLCGDCKKGTRPSFDKSAEPKIANELYEKFIEEVASYGIKTAHGKFGAMMDVALVNDGPVTFMIEI
ncbi:MAG: D-aminoacyl-tRNA deacylase [Candidatus Gastranaerophilales bacterium]|nr:D-aminoacyl-tRNA deacylase [Candidatus Gastranaerophilales bacterium]MCM1073767.1 D-aminoacyl-tRNA deacylase [Bacteroides sp.]